MLPKLEQARKDIWDRPDEDGIIMKRPTAVGQVLEYYTQLLTKLQCYERVIHEVTHCYDRVTHEVT
jgi:hypothetical protein